MVTALYLTEFCASTPSICSSSSCGKPQVDLVRERARTQAGKIKITRGGGEPSMLPSWRRNGPVTVPDGSPGPDTLWRASAVRLGEPVARCCAGSLACPPSAASDISDLPHPPGLPAFPRTPFGPSRSPAGPPSAPPPTPKLASSLRPCAVGARPPPTSPSLPLPTVFPIPLPRFVVTIPFRR